MKVEDPIYAVSEVRLFRPFLNRKLPAILVHWLFQGLLYMDVTERAFKLGIDLVLTALFSVVLAQWLPWYASVGVSLLLAHTMNFLCNAQIYVVLKHFGDVRHTREEVEFYIEALKERIANEPGIRYAAAYGSLARGEMNPTSDLDVRLVRRAGVMNGLRVCWFALYERSRAFWNRFPLDIYVLDSESPLSRLRPDEMPIVLKTASQEGEQAADSIVALWSGLKTYLREPLYANAYFLMANTIVSSGTGFAFWWLAARLCLPADVGLTSAAISAINLVVGLSRLGLGYGLIKFVSRSKNPIRLTNFCFTWSVGLAVIASSFFLIGLPFWSPALMPFYHSAPFPLLFVILAMATVTYQLADQAFVASRRADFALLKNSISGLTSLAFLLLLVSRPGESAIFVAYTGAILVSVLVGVLWLLPEAQRGYRPKFTVNIPFASKFVKYSLGNYLSNLLESVPYWIFPLMVVNILGAESGAYFYVAWLLGGGLTSLSAAISQSLFAESSHDEAGASGYAKRSVLFGLSIVLPLVIGTLLLGNRLLTFFGVSYARNATSLLWLMALAAIPATVVYIYFGLLRARGEMRTLIICLAAIAGISVGLGWFLMIRLGLLGIGVAWLVAQGVVMISLLLRRVLTRREAAIS